MTQVINVATEETAQEMLKELKKISAQLEALGVRDKSNGMTTINITNIRSTGQEANNGNNND